MPRPLILLRTGRSVRFILSNEEGQVASGKRRIGGCIGLLVNLMRVAAYYKLQIKNQKGAVNRRVRCGLFYI